MKKKLFLMMMVCMMGTSVFVSGCGKTDNEAVEEDDEDEDDDDEDTVDDIDDEDEDEDEDTGKVATDKPYTKNNAYFISINGKKYDFNNTITEVEKSGFKMHAQAKDQQVPAGGYLILIGGSRLTDSDSDGFSYTPYNDGKEKIPVSKAKLGSVTIRTPYSDSAKAKFNKITVYGGIHVGSTLAQLKAAFGEPTNKTEASYGDTYEYKDSTYRKYSFSIKNGVVDEITWTNYGSLVR
jgi:hypothetical protein